MPLVGADAEQLRQLSRNFNQAADRLDGMAREVTGRLSSTPWTGPDAARYRSQWQGHSMATLRGAVSALREAATALQRNATEQDHASSASGTGGGLTSASDGGSHDPLTDALNKLLGLGGLANDFAERAGKGFHGLTGDVISGAGVVTSLTTMVEGTSSGDSLQVSDGVIGLGGAALGRANPVLGIAASAAQMYGAMTLPTTNGDIDAVFDMGAQHMFGTSADQLTDSQRDAVNHRYDGAWGVANMISDSMDSKAAAAMKFVGGLFG
jgi:uncharacterized protein YukE